MTAPLVFAHRGSSYDLPEHTLAAYLRALDEGADGLECDVRLTRDGHLVCVHDRRLDRTSNGRGLVSARTLAELEALDFGSWHPAAAVAKGAAPLDESHTRLLTLERLLDAVRSAGRPVRMLIETKHPSRHRGDVERRLVALLRRHGLTEPGPDDPVQVTVMSFSPLAVRRIRNSPRRCPRCCCWRCCRAGCGWAGCPSAAGSPGRGWSWCGPARSWSRRCGRPGTRSTSGP